MRKLNYMVALVLSFGLYSYSGSPAASAGVDATAHDIGGGTGQTCVYCHTPHNAQATADQLIPLWNHATTTTAAYTLYSSPTGTLDGAITQPGGVSKACLSCHDGTVATDAYGGTFDAAGGTPANKLTGNKSLGTDLSNDHPVSIAYDSAADTGLQASPTLPLFASKVECASCHNPHDNTNTKFLRATMDNSGLCTSCHIK